MVTKHGADLPVLCGCFPLAIYFTFGSVYMYMPLSHFVPAYPSPSPCPQVHSLRLHQRYVFEQVITNAEDDLVFCVEKTVGAARQTHPRSHALMDSVQTLMKKKLSFCYRTSVPILRNLLLSPFQTSLSCKSCSEKLFVC